MKLSSGVIIMEDDMEMIAREIARSYVHLGFGNCIDMAVDCVRCDLDDGILKINADWFTLKESDKEVMFNVIVPVARLACSVLAGCCDAIFTELIYSNDWPLEAPPIDASELDGEKQEGIDNVD